MEQQDWEPQQVLVSYPEENLEDTLQTLSCWQTNQIFY